MNLKRYRNIGLFFLIAVVLLLIDQSSKAWASATLQTRIVSYDLGLVELTLVHNAGGAFGIAQGRTGFFIALTVVIVVLILAWLFVTKGVHISELVGFSLVVSGGIGNCIDRVINGYVVDFIQFTFIDFPVFNFADMCVTCGVVLVFISMLVHMKDDETSVSKGQGQ